MVRKLLADQETTKAAYSTMGKANNLHGVQNANANVLIGLGQGCQSLNCCLEGVPLPRYGSWWSILTASASVRVMSGTSDGGVSGPAASCSSTRADLLAAGGVGTDGPRSLGWLRCHLVSGKKKINKMNVTASIATLSHQKLRQFEW